MTDLKPSTHPPSTAGLSSAQLAELLRVGRADADQAGAEDDTLLVLTATDGPSPVSFEVVPPGPWVIGRGADCDLRLVGSEHVSRRHATLVYRGSPEGGAWFIKDNHSKHGTSLNGVKLDPDRRYPLASKDIVEVLPWALSVSLPSAERVNHMTTIQTRVQPQTEVDIRPVMPDPGYQQQLQRLQLLFDCSERFHQTNSEPQLAEAVLEMLATGTSFPNMAVLGPLGKDGGIPVIDQRGAMLMPDGSPRLSRSLIESAAAGSPVRLSNKADQVVTSQSIAELGIAHAVCVPLLIGRAVVGYLYLDHRQSDESPGHASEEEAQFAVAVGRLTALAWANLRRHDMQLRTERMDAALAAAAAAQRWVLPTERVTQGPFQCIGDNRPGELLSGDFFDIIPVDENDVAVVLGDVCGKGVAASIWTTAAQGFLRASLRTNRDLPDIVSGLNRYMQGRSEHSLFMTLWIGLFNAEKQQLSYVDAGHGYALLLSGRPPAVQLNRLADAGGPLIGIEDTSEYAQATVDFTPGQRVLVVSDGIIEQSNPAVSERNEQFGIEGVLTAAAGVRSPGKELDAIYDAVTAHAQGKALSDDATVVLVQYADA